jgi:hypothetical protein
MFIAFLLPGAIPLRSCWLAHVAVTRVCVTVIISGVPVGTQSAWLSSNNKGCPFDVTRNADVMNCALTHGPLAAGGGGNAQPATRYGVLIVTVGMPFTVTRGLGTLGCAWPPCEHITVAPTWSTKPGITPPPARRH